MRTWAIAPFVALSQARGLLFPFVPVFIACGIGLWFGLPFEPGVPFYLGAAAVAVAMMAV